MTATTERQDHLGLSMNDCTCQGKLTEDPQIIDNNGDLCAFMKLRTMKKVQQVNGQFVDLEQIIPLVVMDSSLVQRLVKPYIKAGKQLLVHAYYQTWDDNGTEKHGFITEKIILGSS